MHTWQQFSLKRGNPERVLQDFSHKGKPEGREVDLPLCMPKSRLVNKMKTEKGDDIHMKIGEQLDEDNSVVDDVKEKWDMFWRDYSTEERRILCARCIQIGVEVTFLNHIYWYNTDLCKQSEGC